MNKARLKNFAAWGRKKLNEDLLKTSRDIRLVICNDSLELLAYKWFIRLVIIRYLEIKEILTEILNVYNISELQMKQNLILACSELEGIFPKIFSIDTYNNGYILPANLCCKNSFIYKLIEELNEETCSEVEVIGWLHQFYNSEEHENIVGMNNGIISTKDVPAATQLFTPKWIVKYMVDNSLGRLWVEGKNDSEFKNKLEFFSDIRYKNLKWLKEYREKYVNLNPEDIKFLDPACGSGHILVYAFEIFFDIYAKFGYETEDIPRLIIENNLYGMDIDENTVNLAEAAVLIKGGEKDKNFFYKLKTIGVESNILCIKSADKLDTYKKLVLEETDNMQDAESKADKLLSSFREADIYGSLIEINNFDGSFWNERLNYIDKKLKTKSGDLEGFRKIRHLIRQGMLLSQCYDVVCTNPPYLSKKYMENKLKTFIKKHYADFNGDLFSVFIIRNLKLTKPNGYSGFMTPFVWMFIKEYEELRKFIIENKSVIGLVQLQYSAYSDATVPICTFILGNFSERFPGEYIKLSDFKGYNTQSAKTKEALNNLEVPYRYSCSTEKFKSIPGSTFAYWISDSMLKVFISSKSLEEFIDITGSQNITADNDKYLRRIWEIEKDKINKRWCFYTKGGEYRKWYGNIEYVVDWSKEARSFYRKNKTSNLLSDNYCFREGITYNGISVRGFAVREAGRNIYDKGGPTFHLLDESYRYYILALLNSKVINYIMQLYNPTINYQVQDVKNIPFILSKDEAARKRIDQLTQECIEISKNDWALKETSWEFETHPLIKYRNNSETIEEAFENWERTASDNFNRLKDIEEELNKIFIDIYNLNGEITPFVREDEVTVSKANIIEDIKSFVSFGIGCMMGRYTLREYNSETNFNGILPQSPHNIFEDSITNIFVKFLKASFGVGRLQENLEFVADALGKRTREKPLDTLSRYFLREFYKDHLKIYKKRPIYWLFSSGKSSVFNAYVYFHTYNKDVINILIFKYVENLKEKLQELSKIHTVKKDKLKEQILELETYLGFLKEYASRDVEINKDDGLYNSYCKLKDLLCKI